MILSHTHRFLFLKTRKTGSTSVEIALSHCCDDRDIITPITPRDEYLRLQIGRPCQNFMPDRNTETAYLDQLRSKGASIDLPAPLLRQARFRNHMGYAEIRARIPQDLAGYTIVSIERHPYEKAVSLANFVFGFDSYKRTGDLSADLEDIRATVGHLLHNGQMAGKIRNWDIYAEDGRVVADHILQFATLAEDLAAFAARMHLPRLPALPHTKVGNRDRSLPAAQILTAAHRTAIQDICAEEFDHFGYAR